MDVTVSDLNNQTKYHHNRQNDCCEAECPCLDTFPEPPQIDYDVEGKFPMSTDGGLHYVQAFFPPKPTRCHPARYRQIVMNLVNALWNCYIARFIKDVTSYSLDDEHKDPVPNGPVMAAAIKRGMWSMDQFCQDFKDDTEVKSQFIQKCQKVRQKIINPTTLECCTGRMDGSAKTCCRFVRKCGDRPCHPEWIENDQWLPPESPLETCTTYKNFYKPHYMTPFPENKKSRAQTPSHFRVHIFGHNLWYTCCDPKGTSTSFG
ncbi:unnamed protein product [Orchesella dallaii]|uniref:Uncharacterized protein n=1 Tax=Orchesella dallaii TaxID=48710 RepID=A0ABP1QKZ5_9HEXA